MKRLFILNDAVGSSKGQRFIRRLGTGAQRAGFAVVYTKTGREANPGDVLAMWGPGDPHHDAVLRAAVATGVRVVAWDLGYWNRATCRRLAIDGHHPDWRLLRADPPAQSRFPWNSPPIDRPAHAEGPVVVVGMGSKGRAAYGGAWIKATIPAAVREFRGRVAYKRKPERPIEHEAVAARLPVLDGPVGNMLRSAALVICRHSNVAIDAALAGVPVVASEGAASLIYPRDVPSWRDQPTRAAVLDFLERLAWWQWSESEVEAGAPWPFIRHLLGLRNAT